MDRNKEFSIGKSKKLFDENNENGQKVKVKKSVENEENKLIVPKKIRRYFLRENKKQNPKQSNER